MVGKIVLKGGLAIAALAMFAVSSQAQVTRTSNFKCSMFAPNFFDGVATLQFREGGMDVGALRAWTCTSAAPQEDGTITQLTLNLYTPNKVDPKNISDILFSSLTECIIF